MITSRKKFTSESRVEDHDEEEKLQELNRSAGYPSIRPIQRYRSLRPIQPSAESRFESDARYPDKRCQQKMICIIAKQPVQCETQGCVIAVDETYFCCNGNHRGINQPKILCAKHLTSTVADDLKKQEESKPSPGVRKCRSSATRTPTLSQTCTAPGSCSSTRGFASTAGNLSKPALDKCTTCWQTIGSKTLPSTRANIKRAS